MSRKQTIIIFSLIGIMTFFSFYLTRNRNENHFVREPLKASDIINLEEKNNEKDLGNNSQDTLPPKVEEQKGNAKNEKEMSPSEYVAWLKDTQDRVLLEVKPDGAKIFRKGNVTITVMRNGEELYLPDEF